MDSPVATRPPPADPEATEGNPSPGFPVGAGGIGGGGSSGGFQFPDSPPPRRRRNLWRLVVGCVIVLVASAGASAVAVLEQVHTRDCPSSCV